MIQLQTYNINSGTVSERELSDEFFPSSINEEIVTQVIVATRNNSRQGSACAKTRASVSYSTRKPWRQKGTGRARAGMRKSPIWVKGGVIFPPRPRDFSVNIPVKIKKAAFRTLLSMKIKENNVFLIENLLNASHKTKEVLALISSIPFLKGEKGKILFIYDESNGNLDLALNNVRKFTPINWQSVCTYDIARHGKVLITEEALNNLEKRLENGKE